MTQELANSIDKSFKRIFHEVANGNVHGAVTEAEVLLSWLKVLDSDYEEGEYKDDENKSERSEEV